MIESAKTRAILNEIRNYKQAAYTFYASKGRLPGDLNGSGKIGLYSNQTYSVGDFASPYDVAGDEYGIPIDKNAPFVDLYLEGVIDFQPKNVSSSNYGIATPYFLNKNDSLYYEYQGDSTITDQNNFKYQMPYGNYITIFGLTTDNQTIGSSSYINKPKIVKYVDEKIDDGKYNGGKVRSYCNGKNGWGKSSFEEGIEDKKYLCQHTFVSLDL